MIGAYPHRRHAAITDEPKGLAPALLEQGTEGPAPTVLRDQARHADLLRELRLRRRYGRTTGALVMAGALASIPSTILLDSEISRAAYVLPFAACAIGLACLGVPWERVSLRWLHLVVGLAVADIALSVALIDPAYDYYYLLIAVLAAYVFRSRIELGAQLGLISLGVLAPLVYDGMGREVLHRASLTIPGLLLAAWTVAYLSQLLERKQRAYRRFAEEVLELVIRISGERPLATVEARRAEPRHPPLSSEHRAALDALLTRAAMLGLWRGPRPAPRRAAVVGLGGLLATSLLATGLAIAGVRLPSPITAPFSGVGIHLPNQKADEDPSRGRPALETPPPAGPEAPPPARTKQVPSVDRLFPGWPPALIGRRAEQTRSGEHPDATHAHRRSHRADGPRHVEKHARGGAQKRALGPGAYHPQAGGYATGGNGTSHGAGYPGNSGATPGHGGLPPGHGGAPPGHGGAPPGHRG